MSYEYRDTDGDRLTVSSMPVQGEALISAYDHAGDDEARVLVPTAEAVRLARAVLEEAGWGMGFPGGVEVSVAHAIDDLKAAERLISDREAEAKLTERRDALTGQYLDRHLGSHAPGIAYPAALVFAQTAVDMLIEAEERKGQS